MEKTEQVDKIEKLQLNKPNFAWKIKEGNSANPKPIEKRANKKLHQ